MKREWLIQHFRILHSAFSIQRKPVAFLDVEVNPIAKDVGHIYKRIGVSKNASKVGIILIRQADLGEKN